MEKTVFSTTNTLAELMVQLGDETKRDFTCNMYDDGFAEVPGVGFRIRRIPDDISDAHKVSAPVGDLYLITKFFNDVDEATYLGATAGISEFPVRADEKTVTAIREEMDRRYLDEIANALTRNPACPDPATGITWTAYSLDQVSGMKEEGRAAYVAHDGDDAYFAFDVLDDGSTEVMVKLGSGIAEMLFQEVQEDA